MCRRELDKAESEIKKNSSIIGDYKQVGPCTLELGCAPSSPAGPHEVCPLLTRELLVLNSRMREMAARSGVVAERQAWCVPCRLVGTSADRTVSLGAFRFPFQCQGPVWSCAAGFLSPWLFAF